MEASTEQRSTWERVRAHPRGLPVAELFKGHKFEEPEVAATGGILRPGQAAAAERKREGVARMIELREAYLSECLADYGGAVDDALSELNRDTFVERLSEKLRFREWQWLENAFRVLPEPEEMPWLVKLCTKEVRGGEGEPARLCYVLEPSELLVTVLDELRLRPDYDTARSRDELEKALRGRAQHRLQDQIRRQKREQLNTRYLGRDRDLTEGRLDPRLVEADDRDEEARTRALIAGDLKLVVRRSRELSDERRAPIVGRYVRGLDHESIGAELERLGCEFAEGWKKDTNRHQWTLRAKEALAREELFLTLDRGGADDVAQLASASRSLFLGRLDGLARRPRLTVLLFEVYDKFQMLVAKKLGQFVEKYASTSDDAGYLDTRVLPTEMPEGERVHADAWTAEIARALRSTKRDLAQLSYAHLRPQEPGATSRKGSSALFARTWASYALVPELERQMNEEAEREA